MLQLKDVYIQTSQIPIAGILLILLTVFYCISVLYLLIGLFRIPRRTNSKKHFFSVIIAAHNEEQHIEQCLTSVLAQDYPSDLFEVIVADDRSNDATSAIIDHLSEKNSKIRSVRIQESKDAVPKKTALLQALSIAQGDIIISTDADCILPKTWLAAMNSYFSENVGMVIGHTGYPEPDSLWKGIDATDYLSQRALGAAFIGVRSAYTCTASNFAYRRIVFDMNREEFSRLKVRPAEDNYLLHCVHRNSDFAIAVATDPGSYATTNGAANIKHFLQQRFRWGAYGGTITTWGVKLFFIPALAYYVFFWIALASSMILPNMLPVFTISLISKMTIDFLFMLKATSLYHCSSLLKYFLPASIMHLFLYPVIVLKGNLFSFEWKGRRYTKDRAVDR